MRRKKDEEQHRLLGTTPYENETARSSTTTEEPSSLHPKSKTNKIKVTQERPIQEENDTSGMRRS